jgi:CRISP-associated protein Cas1
LYGISQAGILALGLSPALGFIHTGKMLSFVYDIADLYKTQVSIPAAFQAVGDGEQQLESRARKAVRDTFRDRKLLKIIVADIQSALDLQGRGRVSAEEIDFDSDAALPGALWNPSGYDDVGGRNFAVDLPNGDTDGDPPA